MKYWLLTLLIFFQFSVKSQSNNSNLKIFKNSQIGIEFKYPNNWDLGTPSISNVYWVGIPNYPSEGSVVLKVVPWKFKVEIKNYSKEKYKNEILSTSIYYKDLEFIEFNNHIEISGVDGIFSYYKGVGKYINTNYYEVLIQWWENNLLFTLQGQFKEPQLTNKQILEFKNIVKSIKIL